MPMLAADPAVGQGFHEWTERVSPPDVRPSPGKRILKHDGFQLRLLREIVAFPKQSDPFELARQDEIKERK